MQRLRVAYFHLKTTKTCHDLQHQTRVLFCFVLFVFHTPTCLRRLKGTLISIVIFFANFISLDIFGSFYGDRMVSGK